MKKLIWIAIMILLIGLTATACGELPEKPSIDQVRHDVEAGAANKLIGEVKEIGEEILLQIVTIDEMELSWVEDDNTLKAEVTAFFGDEHWQSENKVSLSVEYQVNSSDEWEVAGMHLDKILIPVIPLK